MPTSTDNKAVCQSKSLVVWMVSHRRSKVIRVISLKLLPLLAVILAACGGGATTAAPPASAPAISGPAGASGAAKPSAAAVASTPAGGASSALPSGSTAAKAAASGAAARIGFIDALTGPQGALGLIDQQQVELALDEFGSTGGSKIDSVAVDDQADPKLGVTAFHQEVDVNKVPVVLTGYSSPVLAMAPIADDSKTLLFNCWAVSPNLIGAGKYLYNMAPVVTYDAQILADWASKQGFKRLAVTFANNDAGFGTRDAATKAFGDKGIPTVDTESHEVNSKDFTAQITKMKAQNPDVIFVATVTNNDTGLFMRQARDLGVKAQFVSGYQADLTAQAQQIAGDAWEGTVFTNPFALSDHVDQLFKAKYGKASANTTLGQAPYNCANIAAQTISNASKQGNPLTGDGLFKTLNGMQSVKLPDGSSIIFNADHTVKANEQLKMVKGGKAVVIQTIQP